MTKNISKAVDLTTYMITLPQTSYLILAILVLGFVFGVIVSLVQAQPLPNAVIDGMLLLALPALLSSIAVKLMALKLPYRRIAATAFAGVIIYSIVYTASLLLSGVDLFWAQYALLFGSGLASVFWWVTARYVFMLKYRSLLFAGVQLLFYLVFLYSTQTLYATAEPFLDVALRFYVSSAVMLAAGVSLFFIIDAPAKRSLNIPSTSGISTFFSQWFYGGKEMEEFMRGVGEPVKTLVGVMGFKRKNDTVFFVTPFVHFGPFGNLGGSQFSHLLADEIDRKHGSRTFVFHGTATHDLNPVASTEMFKIIDALEAAIAEAEYKDARVSISVGKMEECQAHALRINDSAMIGVTRAPEVTEDISLGVGLAMLFRAEKKVDKAMIVDQHNAETGELTWFDPGSLEGFKYIGAVGDSLSKDSRRTPLKLGVSFRHIDSSTVGGAGIKVAVFSSSPEYVAVLIDSNGVKAEFRDHIESEVKKLGKSMGREFAVGVYTTDTHEVNITAGIVNPLTDEEKIMAVVKEACKEAASDMQKATFFADRKWFEINVMGTKRAMEMVALANAAAAVARAALPSILAGALLLLFVVATKI